MSFKLAKASLIRALVPKTGNNDMSPIHGGALGGKEEGKSWTQVSLPPCACHLLPLTAPPSHSDNRVYTNYFEVKLDCCQLKYHLKLCHQCTAGGGLVCVTSHNDSGPVRGCGVGGKM